MKRRGKPWPILRRLAQLGRGDRQAPANSDDLTRQRDELQRQLRERTQELAATREAAARASLAKSRFIGNLSHEIRTPVNAIIGLTHLLRRGRPTPEQADRLGKIDMAANHLRSFINDILDISRIEANTLQLDHTDFVLGEIFDGIRALIADELRTKKLVFEIDAAEVPMWLRGDPARLRQALFNYVGNAIKFSEKGRIILRAVLRQEAAADLLLYFEVEDFGIGMDAERIATLFRAFEPAADPDPRSQAGSGLGLVITRRLVELMGGEVGVASQPDKGSRFWFTARLQRGRGPMPALPEVAAETAEAELRRRHGGTRLLLVEDDVINREVALELLYAAGLDVEIAVDGQDAIDKAQANAFSLILMDVQMPRLDGLQATRAIRALPQYRRIPILALTANVFEENRRACMEVGMDDFVAKPVNPADLYAALLKWLQRSPLAATPAPPPAAQAAPQKIPAPTRITLPRLDTAAWRARLEPLPGLDFERGLEVVRGDATTYSRILALFAESHADSVAQIIAGNAAQDRSALKDLAHTLKGSGGSVGAVRVTEAAKALHSAIVGQAERDEVDRCCTALIAALTQLIDGLRKVLCLP